METFGERLRKEREARGTSIEAVSARTGIRLDFLEALEATRFAKLPGRAFGKMYIRAYGEMLGFDPRSLIEQYDRERAEWEKSAPPPAPPEPDTFAPEADGSGGGPRLTTSASPATRAAPMAEQPLGRRPARAALILGGFVVTAALGYYGFLRRAPESPSAATPPGDSVAATTRPAATPPQRPAPPKPTGPDGGTVTQPVSPPRAEAPIRRVAAAPRAAGETRAPLPSPPAGSLSVVESGIGRRVANHHLEGESDRFAPDDRAIFWTRVSGGGAGTLLRHVWMRDGRAVQTIDLTLGGADWRTWSRKTVHEPGAWSVEARDAAGNVLARAEFVCAAE